MNEDLMPPDELFEGESDNRRQWIIVAVVAFLIISCCLFLVAAWYLGDYVMELFGFM